MYHTIVVTGGAGFIGSNFIHHIIKKHGDSIQVVNLDKLTYAGNLENLKDVENLPNYHFVNADICDGEAVTKILDTYNPDAVINFAAETHVDRSITDPGVFARTNVMGTLNLLNCFYRRSVRLFGRDRLFYRENSSQPQKSVFCQ